MVIVIVEVLPGPSKNLTTVSVCILRNTLIERGLRYTCTQLLYSSIDILPIGNL